LGFFEEVQREVRGKSETLKKQDNMRILRTAQLRRRYRVTLNLLEKIRELKIPDFSASSAKINKFKKQRPSITSNAPYSSGRL